MAEEDERSQGNFLTRKVGPLPTWAWLGLLAGAGVGLWYFSRQQAASATSAAQAGTAAAQTPQNAAASGSSMNGMGYLPVPAYYTTPSTSTGSTTANTSTQTVTVGPAPGKPNTGVWSQDVAAYTSPTAQGTPIDLPFGSYPSAGPVVAGAGGGMYPITVNGQTLYVLGENVSSDVNQVSSSLSNAVQSNVA